MSVLTKQSLSMNKNRRSHRIIHVKIGFPRAKSLNSIHSKSVTQSNSISESVERRRDILSDHRDLTKNHHKSCKQKKKKSLKLCLVALLLIILLIVIVIGITLFVLLIKPTNGKLSTDIPPLRWNNSGITVTANNQLYLVQYITFDLFNNLYVTDRGNYRIKKFSNGNPIGKIVAGNGTGGQNLNQLLSPGQIVCDENENLYIADSYNHRILFWAKGASEGTIIAGTGTSGNTMSELNTPYGFNIHPLSGIYYISDTSNLRFLSHIHGENYSTIVLNGPGLNDNQVKRPCCTHYESFSDTFLIADSGSNSILRYVPGTTKRSFVVGDINGNGGSTSARLQLPTDVRSDPMGNIYIADCENHHIQFFYNGQQNGSTIAGITGIFSKNTTTLYWPRSLALDNQLNLYVADTFNHRIQKFLRY